MISEFAKAKAKHIVERLRSERGNVGSANAAAELATEIITEEIERMLWELEMPQP